MIAATYARYSSDAQRAASIDDQERNCDAVAERHGWTVEHRYRDHAVSGAVSDRPEYRRMLEDAEAGQFQALLIDDLSRLGRDQVECEQAIRRLEYWGIRILAVSDGYDSADPAGTRKIHRAFKNMMNELYLDDLREKTHRGLTGQALKGHNAGGRTYGYRHVPIEDPTRTDRLGRPLVIAVRREVDPEQAAVVRRIYTWYADGHSPMWIAAELNRLGIEAPRGGTWSRTAIYGDRRAGVGILNNPLYRGDYIWNRSRWVKDPDTGRRRRIERPESEWIVHHMPELRIVDEDLWRRVASRLDANRRESTSRALAGKGTGGRRPKYLFSGLLVCGVCGANYVLANNRAYGCAGHRDRGTHVCDNAIHVRRDLVESRLLEHIKEELLTDEAMAYFRKETTRLLGERKRETDDEGLRRRLGKLEREIENMVDAIRQGTISTALQNALTEAETQRDRLAAELATRETATLPDILPRLGQHYRELVDRLEDSLKTDIPAAREALKGLVGDTIRLYPTEQGILEAEIGVNFEGLIRLTADQTADRVSKTMVAGAGFEPTTFGL